MSRRANHEGTIVSRGGKFYARLMLDGVRHVGPTVARKQDAIPALRQKLRAFEDARRADASPPLSTLMEQRIQQMQGSPTTRDLWRATLNRLEGLGDLTPAEATPAEVLAWHQSLPLAPRTRRNYLAIVLQLLRESGHPVDVRLPRIAPPRERVMPPDQIARLLAAEMPERLRPIVQMAVLLGLRRSEIAGLHHRDRDEDGVLVQRAVVRVKGAIVVKGTKSGATRWIPLPDELAWIGAGTGYVVSGAARPASPSTIDDRWRAWREGTEFAEYGLHDLRASCGMALLERGVDVRTAADILGHDPQVLLGIYARSRRDLKRAAIGRRTGSTDPV